MKKFKGLSRSERNRFPEGVESPFQGPHAPTITVDGSAKEFDISKRIAAVRQGIAGLRARIRRQNGHNIGGGRIADIMGKIDALGRVEREQARPSRIVNTYLPLIEDESDVGRKRDLLKTLFSFASTERVSEKDVAKMIKLQSKDPILLVLVAEIVRDTE